MDNIVSQRKTDKIVSQQGIDNIVSQQETERENIVSQQETNNIVSNRRQYGQHSVQQETTLVSCRGNPDVVSSGQSGNRAYWETQHTQLLRSLSPALLDEYGEDYMTETKDLFQSHASHANPDLSPVVDAIATALLAPRPAPRYFAGPGVGLMYFVHSYCPRSVSGRFLQRLFVQKTLPPLALRTTEGHGLDIHNNNNNNNNEDKEDKEDK
ncbi:corticosteroid 11-beta-dehydrogenase isozyme 2-like [Etheostoma cragini]|uniref:corticosteroid 11-beta-dehydrogenase isozyme 2-like n=1 Tax=Etheostoma cragini TaxID=417921 RepID=UPI00155F1965|nr:corticosteroid 11-beta-dehydrogenase isozyme 2-like [Etheostoma cragini]